jgi:hypothetical protein
MNMYNAFLEAKNLVHQQTRDLAAVYFELDLLPYDQQAIIETDPYPLWCPGEPGDAGGDDQDV